MVTLTYNGGQRAMPNYNVMAWRRRAGGLGDATSRSISGAGDPRQRHLGGADRTLAGAGISDARQMFAFQQRHSPLRRGVTLEEIGGAALYLLSTFRPASPATSICRFRLQHHHHAAAVGVKETGETENGNGAEPTKDAAQ